MKKVEILVPVVLACLPFACAVPAPREYRQAPALPGTPAVRPVVPRAPGNPGFNPAEDAPHTFGEPRREYPKSPYTRVLPQDEKTRGEDGLWAAEAPRAVDDDSPLRITHEFFPLPPDATKAEQEIAKMCQDVANYALSLVLQEQPPEIRDAWNNKTPATEGRCVRVRLYGRCIDLAHDDLVLMGLPDSGPASLKRLRDFTERLVIIQCGGNNRHLSEIAKNIFDQAFELLREGYKESAKGGRR